MRDRIERDLLGKLLGLDRVVDVDLAARPAPEVDW
jgi:hypothetical protein